MDRGAWRATVHGVAKSQTPQNNEAQHTAQPPSPGPEASSALRLRSPVPLLQSQQSSDSGQGPVARLTPLWVLTVLHPVALSRPLNVVSVTLCLCVHTSGRMCVCLWVSV